MFQLDFQAVDEVSIFSQEKGGYPILIFPKVMENMGCRFKQIASFRALDKGMLKEILAEFLQQGFFGLKVAIEGGTAYICQINDFLNGDAFVAFLIEQADKGLVNGCA